MKHIKTEHDPPLPQAGIYTLNTLSCLQVAVACLVYANILHGFYNDSSSFTYVATFLNTLTVENTIAFPLGILPSCPFRIAVPLAELSVLENGCTDFSKIKSIVSS